MNEWYQELIKPEWAPPAFLFGPVWSVLYVIIAISFFYVAYHVMRGKWSVRVFLPFGLNLVFNFAFTPLQFGLKNNVLAFIDIVLVWVTIVWMFYVIRSYAKWVIYINMPYFLWVSFATVLQATIMIYNL